MKLLDRYIFVRYLSTFIYCISLFLLITVVFDITEKIDDFLAHDVPFNKIITGYYFNFLPYFGNMFSPLFVFIAVIFFTSKMSQKSEIVAILASGIGFWRMLYPYMMGALCIALGNYMLASWLLPPANQARIHFMDTYIDINNNSNNNRNIHLQSAATPNQYYYLESYTTNDSTGYRFAVETFENQQLTAKMLASRIEWLPRTKKWRLYDFYYRTINNTKEKVVQAAQIDTTLGITPADFTKPLVDDLSFMNNTQLDNFIATEKRKGRGNLEFYETERQKRISEPVSTFILTLIGVALCARKSRGGLGLNLGIGIGLSFSYIMFMRFATVFATASLVPPLLAAWIPNILFGILAFFLLKTAPK
jgi:lipopolysaccharide export system permease protein